MTNDSKFRAPFNKNVFMTLSEIDYDSFIKMFKNVEYF